MKFLMFSFSNDISYSYILQYFYYIFNSILKKVSTRTNPEIVFILKSNAVFINYKQIYFLNLHIIYIF